MRATRTASPYAFFAVVSICVIGLYIAYVMPVYLRWRMGDAFEPGPWTLGNEVQVGQPGGDHLGRDLRDHLLPAVHARRACRGATSSTGSYVNYAPITVGAVLLIVGVWWAVSAKHTFKGPVRTVEFDDGAGVQ